MSVQLHVPLPSTRLIALGLLWIATLCSGCQLAGRNDTSLTNGDWKSSLAKKPSDKIDFGQAERMAVVWSDSTATATGVASVRGFGGRIYFYDKAGKPVRVDGDLSVYAFDDSTGEEKTSADRVFKFRQSDLQKHFSESQLGPSYSVWIPWDKVGGDRKSIALMPVFKSVGNQVVKSGQSINVLPGKTPPQLAELSESPYRVLGASPSVALPNRKAAPQQASNYGVQLVSNTEAIAPEDIALKERTTTIDVPRQMMRRLNQELASGSVEGVSAGMNANVSFGPRSPSNVLGSDINKSGFRGESEGSEANLEGSAASANQVDAPRTRPRVFGAPGALK